MAEYKKLAQCKLSSPCEGGISWLTTFMPLEKVRVGSKGVLDNGRVWEIQEAYTNLVVSSEYIAWYKTFGSMD